MNVRYKQYMLVDRYRNELTVNTAVTLYSRRHGPAGFTQLNK